MIKSLQLENFKAFGQRAIIPFAPITLIFGENSSGKSSILQSLNLLKQTRESREAGALLLPRTDQGISDLGSFQDILFDHNLKNPLSIRIEFEPDRRGDPFFRSLTRHFREVRDLQSGAIEVSFERPSLDDEVRLREIALFLSGDEFLATFRPFKSTRSLTRELLAHYPRDARQSYSGRPKLAVARCEELSESPSLWEPLFFKLKEDAPSIVAHLRQAIDNEFVRFQPLFTDIEEEQEQHQLNARKEMEQAIAFYSSDFDLEAFGSRLRSQQLKTVIGLDGFIPVSTPRVNENFFPELIFRPNRLMGMGWADIGRIAGLFGSALDRLLKLLFPLGPFRRPPERWYIFTGTSPEDVGYRGELLPDLLFRNPRLIKEANDWLLALEVGYQLRVQPLGPSVKDLFEVRLIDTRRKKPVDVGLPDVGFGISQILPLIVQSLSSDNKIISIEQPEVHIHPRLQADLGDLLAETIKEPRRNQFIIETHSEHLVLRLQKLVREKKLSPVEVSIIYVTRSPSGAKARRLNLDEDGDFIDDWPGGFFPERLRELR